MNLKELVKEKLSYGYELKDARNLVAEEIVIKKISSSEMAERVTLKGGIVIYNLSKSDRRVTQDIDFDLIRYSIEEESIKAFISNMNKVNDGLLISIEGNIENLHQEDYQGVRVHLLLKDKYKNSLRIKLDIGVHSYTAIEQEKMVFCFSSNDQGVSIKANPPEQIFAEKLISLARLGAISTRYKDIYDFYFLIEECKISPKKVFDILDLFFTNSKKKPKNIIDLRNAVEAALSNKTFIEEASKPASKWIDKDINDIKQTILNFIDLL